jgi:hypothetical protein
MSTVKIALPSFDGYFIDFQKFHQLYKFGKLQEISKCQDLRKNFPQIFVSDPDIYEHKIFFSHRWDLASNPDIRNWQIAAIAEYASELHMKNKYPACFWYDYISLPQVPRTKQEEALFRQGMKSINKLCKECSIVALISSSNGLNLKDTILNTLKRGWILCELFIASKNERITNILFEDDPPGNRVVMGKINKPAWLSLIPGIVNTLPYYDTELTLHWFNKHSIVCTNGADLKFLAERLNLELFSYILQNNITTPTKLSFNRTYNLTDIEASEYYIDINGISAIFPDTYFEHTFVKSNVYEITPKFRPKLPQIDEWHEIPAANLAELSIDPLTGISKMYHGIIFKQKIAGNSIKIRPELL